jgi:hypothetical protein
LAFREEIHSFPNSFLRLDRQEILTIKRYSSYQAVLSIGHKEKNESPKEKATPRDGLKEIYGGTT